MSEKMLKFVNTKGQTPEKSSPSQRIKNFSEIYKNYIAPKAEEQSSRCSQCGVPYCQIHCPLSNNIPDWLKLTAEGRLEEAYEISSATNNMPEVCGRICPQDRLCEGNCVIERAGHGTVTIGSIEKFITDTAFEEGWVKPIKIKKDLGQSVGIIGAGPAGLAAAEQLRKIGYEITVYDKYAHDTQKRLNVQGLTATGIAQSRRARKQTRVPCNACCMTITCERMLHVDAKPRVLHVTSK